LGSIRSFPFDAGAADGDNPITLDDDAHHTREVVLFGKRTKSQTEITGRGLPAGAKERRGHDKKSYNAL